MEILWEHKTLIYKTQQLFSRSDWMSNEQCTCGLMHHRLVRMYKVPVALRYIIANII